MPEFIKRQPIIAGEEYAHLLRDIKNLYSQGCYGYLVANIKCLQ